MADAVLFEVDAAKILAKLHLAGQSQIKGKGFIVNSGIKNDAKNATPENPGKVTFDLTNKTGDYQVGYVNQVTYTKSYAFDGIDKVLSELSELVKKKTGAGVDAKVDSNDEKKIEELKKKVADAFINDPKQLKDGDKDTGKLDTVDGIAEIKKIADDQNTADKGAYEKAMTDASTEAISNLKTYLDTFAGADHVEQFKEANMILVSSAAKDQSFKDLVKDFEIQPISEAEKTKLGSAFAAKKGENNCVWNVCFRVQYHLDIDK